MADLLQSRREGVNISSELSSTSGFCQLLRRRFPVGYRIHRGATTGIVITKADDCPCRSRGSFIRQWDFVDSRFKHHRLKTITPSERSRSPIEEQVAHIQTLRDNPHASYFLQGTGSAGKTTLAHCLYRHRLEEWSAAPNRAEGLSVWMLSANEYLTKLSQHAQNPSSPAPVVTPDLIRKRSRQGLPVALFIDEMDKFSPTEAKLDNLFTLVNAVHACEGQIVMTSNAAMKDLAKSWGGSIGIHTLRRVGAEPDGTTLTFTNRHAAATPKAGI